MSELKEIRDVALENAKEVVEQNKETIQDAYKWIMHLECIAHREGLLALECEACFLPKDLPLCDRIIEMIELAVDGTEPAFFSELLTLKFMTNQYQGSDAFLYYLYARSILLIQQGTSAYQIEQFINATIPNKMIYFGERQKINEEWKEQEKANIKNNLSDTARKELADISKQLAGLNNEEWKQIVSSYGFYGFDKLLPLLDETTQDKVASYMNQYRVYTIMNTITAVTEQEIVQMAEELKLLIQKIRKKAEEKSLLDDIRKYSDKEIQRIMREVDNHTLTLALKGEKDEITECFFRNLSFRLKNMIKEDMECMEPVKLSEVEEAQKEIMQIAHKVLQGK